jgi:hypothetical protein
MLPLQRRPLAVTLLAILACVLVESHAPSVLTIPASLLLVLVLPGAAVVRLERHLQRPPLEGAGLVLATSMGITVVLGVAINFLPGGLDRTNWSLALLVAVIIGSFITQWRGPTDVPGRRPSAHLGVGGVARATAKLVVVAGLVAGLVWISITSENAWEAREHFTGFAVENTRELSLQFGVLNHEGTAVRYTLDADMSGKQIFTTRVTVGSAQSTTITVPVTADDAFSDSRLTLRLYRVGHAGVYRSLWLTPHEGKWL